MSDALARLVDGGVLAFGVERPLLRGWLHLFAAGGAIAAAVWLILMAETPTGYVSAPIFGASLIALYWTSASYHVIPWGPAVKNLFKRLDHAMIFVLIGGTYTPFCLAVDLPWGIPLLAVVWSLAGIGVLFKVIWPDAPRWLGVGLYVGLGWMAVVAAAEVLEEFAVTPIALLILGGVLYTAGSAMYAARRPDPWPRVFGYHEVFHVLVIAGSGLHYWAIARYVL